MNFTYFMELTLSYCTLQVGLEVKFLVEGFRKLP